MKKLSPRERRLALIFLAVLGLTLFWQAAARPLLHRLISVNHTLKVRQELIARAKSTAGELPKLETDNKTLVGQRQLLLLSGEVIPEMIVIIGQAAKAAKVGEVDLRPLPVEKKAGYLRQPMQLQCKASFLRVKDLLFYLEKEGNPLLVERLEISSEPESGNLQATFSVVGFALTTGGKP
jgi:hypothetical protein